MNASVGVVGDVSADDLSGALSRNLKTQSIADLEVTDVQTSNTNQQSARK